LGTYHRNVWEKRGRYPAVEGASVQESFDENGYQSMRGWFMDRVYSISLVGTKGPGYRLLDEAMVLDDWMKC
jgi:hypothetical protein